MMKGMTQSSRYATTAGPVVGVGALVMLASLVGAPGSWLTGYVSEAGTTGQPYAMPYRWGVVVLALGVALLGAAFAEQPAGRSRSPLVAVLLAATALMAATSGVVTCSDGCPLPPFEPTTTADVVHTGAGVAGMALLAVAMLVVALCDPRPLLRRMAVAGAACTVPIGLAMGAGMLLSGRGPLVSVLERLLLTVTVTWLIGTSAATVARPAAVAAPRAGR